MKNKFGVIEVGSTNTKGYICTKEDIEEFPFRNIEFKKNYKANGEITKEDKEKLFIYIERIKEHVDKVQLYGTSIFRELDKAKQDEFIQEVKEKTGAEFNIVSAEMENTYTVFGAIKHLSYEGNIAVMIGGGGSTEIAICNSGKILEVANSSFGVLDTVEKFGDLNNQYATSNRDELVSFILENLNKPKLKADVLILAGGHHILCYEKAGYPIEKNTIFEDPKQKYSISAEKRAEYDLEFYYNINLDELRKYTPDNPNWWNGTRAMCSFSKCVADIVEARYVIPTNINMVYGIVEEMRKEK